MVRLRQVGDVALTTPAIHAVRRRFPDAHISYVVEPAAAPIVANNPHIDELIVAPVSRRRGFGGIRRELALIRRLRAERYDLAIDFHGGPRASLLTWMSGARMRIGYAFAWRGWMYTKRIARPRELRPRHSVENQWDLLAPLEIGPPDPDRFPIEMPVDAATERSVAVRLADAGVNGAAQLIVIHVSASSPFRRWPADSFAQAIAELAAGRANRRIIVTSGPSEGDAANRIIAEARRRAGPPQADRILQCGEFSLAELRALADRAAVYIGGDSGPLHVAAASAVPIVALYGPTLPVRSKPWRPAAYLTAPVDAGPLPCRPCDQRVCIPGDFRCLTRIEPGAVVSAANRLLTTGDPERVAPQTPSRGASLSGSHPERSRPVVTRFGVLAYGARPRLHAECHAAILSVIAHAPAETEFVVLTDHPNGYRWLQDSVRIEHLSATTLEAWRGPAHDRYRPKIEALRWLAAAGDASIVLIDTDTLARRDLGPLVDHLAHGRFLLHRREYPLSAPPRRGDRMLKQEILGRSWNGIVPTAQTAMWNGGVIGCPSDRLAVLDQVPAVFDQMRSASKHFAIEQLAYSVVFEAHGGPEGIEEAAPWIDHYWANRELFSRAVEHELAAMLMSAMTPREAAAHLREHPITGPLDGRPSRWQRMVPQWIRS